MISKRLTTAAEFTKGFRCLADCGTDHGYLPILALQQNYIEKAYASDNKEEPLNNAKNNVREAGLEDKIILLLDDGLPYLNEEIDIISILGMGGRLIQSILEESELIHVKRMVLSPNSEHAILRSYLQKLNWKIVDERFIEDRNKHYQIIVVEPGKMNLSNIEQEFGPMIIQQQSREFIKFIHKQIHTLEKALVNVQQDKDRESLTQRINDLKEVLK